jgi:hypothetical protein
MMLRPEGAALTANIGSFGTPAKLAHSEQTGCGPCELPLSNEAGQPSNNGDTSPMDERPTCRPQIAHQALNARIDEPINEPAAIAELVDRRQPAIRWPARRRKS